MSWIKTVQIQCDAREHGCMVDADHLEHDETIGDARKYATKHGWSFEDGIDICPSCIYVRETGCKCDTRMEQDGTVIRQTHDGANRGCSFHGTTLRPMAKRAKCRPQNYGELSGEMQWQVDKDLGILDWDGR